MLFSVENKEFKAKSIKALRTKIRHSKAVFDLGKANITNLLVKGATVFQHFKNGTKVKYKIEIEKHACVGYASRKVKRSGYTAANVKFVLQ